eukprot:scaffold353_cov185-Amphora_coffeaeformis.AAC.12
MLSVMKMVLPYATALPPKTPARGSTKGSDTPQVCYEAWKENSASRLVGSSRAITVEVPGKGSPFDTFRLNSTHIAVDETNAYETKIKVLEEALEEERAQRKALESSVKQSFETPAPFRGVFSSTPGSATRSGLDADSLYERNQTLVKEVRFAEQTCIESRVSEIESLLSSAEAEKSNLLRKCREWENKCREAQEETNTASDREGKLIRAILDQEKLTKDLKAAREKCKRAEEHAKSLEQINDEREALQSELDECRCTMQALQEEKETSETLRRNDANQICHLEAELDRKRDAELQLQKTNKSLRLHIEELRESLNQQKEESSAFIQAERHRLFSQLHSLESELQNKESDLLQSQSKVELLTRQLSEANTHQYEAEQILDQENSALRKELSKLTAESGSLREALHESESKLVEERSVMESLQMRFEESEKMRKDMETSEESRNREIDSLREAQGESENEKMELNNSVNSLRQTIEELESALSSTKEEAAVWLRSLKESEDQRLSAETESERLRKSLVESEKKLETTLADYEALSKQYAGERFKYERLEQNFSSIQHAKCTSVNEMPAEAESLQTSLKLKEEEVEKLSQRYSQVEFQLAEAIEERNRLLEFKRHATDALHNLPDQLNLFCNKVEELINSKTDPMGDRIEDLAQLASHLTAAIVFEQDWEVMDGDPVGEPPVQDSAGVESVPIQNIYEEEEHPNDSSTQFLPYEADPLTSPNKTVNLELMEEARSASFQEDTAYSNRRGVEGDGSDESDSLSTIAGLSHLFSEDKSPDSKKACSVSALSSEPTTEEKQYVQESDEMFSLKTRITELMEQLQSLSTSFREAQLERDLLKETLKNANKSVGEVDESEEMIRPQESLAERDQLEKEVPNLQNCIQTSKGKQEDADRNARAAGQSAQEELNMFRKEASDELQKLRDELDRKTELLDEKIREVERLMGHCNQLEHDAENQSREMQRLICLNEESKAKSAALQNKIEKLETASESMSIEMNEKASDVTSEVKRLTGYFDESKADASALRNKLGQLESEKVETDEKLKNAEHELEQLTVLYEASIAESRELQAKLQQIQRTTELDKDETEDILNHAENEIAHLTKALQQSENKKQNLQYKFQLLQQEHQAMKDGLSAEIDRKQKELDEQTESVARLAQQNKGNTDETSKTRKIVERLQSELSVLNLTIDKLASELQDARDDTARFRKQSDEKDGQISELQAQLDTAQKQACDAAKELTRMESELDKVLQKNDDLHSANKDMVSVVQDNRRLSQKLDSVTTERNQFNDDLEFAKVRISNLENEVADLRSQKKDLTLALQETHESMRDIESEVESTRMRLAKVHAENASLRSCDRSRQQERDEIEAALKTKLETEQERQERDASRILELTSANRDLSSRLEALEHEKENLINELDTYNDYLSFAKSENTSLEERLGAMSEEKEKLERSYQECNKRLITVSKALDEAKESMEWSEKCHRAAEELAEDAEQRVSMLQSSLTALENNVKALRAEAAKKEETIHSLQNDANAASKRLEELGKTAEEAEKRNVDLSATCHTLQSEKAELLSDREALRSNMKFAETLVAESEQENEKMKSELMRVTDELQSKDQEISSLKKESQALENLAQSTEDRYLECRNILTKLEGERDSLREELGCTRNRLSESEKKFDLVSNELEKIQAEKEQATIATEKIKADLSAVHAIAKDSETRLYRARSEIGTLVSQRDALKSSSTELAEAQVKLEKFTAESRQMQNDISDYREHLAQAQGRIQECTERQRQLQEELQGVVQERDALKSECEKLEKDCQDASKSTAESRKQLSDALEKLDISESDISALQHRLTDSEERCGGLESEVSQLHEMLHHKDSRVQELEKKCKGLRQYTRKVAKKCDGWETYFEKQNGMGEGIPNGRQ